MGIIGAAKPCDTASFTGYLSNAPANEGGVKQAGGWAQPVGGFTYEVIEAVDAVSYVILAGQDSRLKQAGTRQQLSLIISLSGDASGYQLTPAVTNAKGTSVSPAGAYFTGISRQKFVCTFDNLTGKIMPVGIGQCEVECCYPVAQVNANWSTNGLNVAGSGGATSNQSNFISATINVTVTR